jgi:triacylglycerol esterase/lipase EstA (alpha/beta hydrolase family)
LAPARRRFVVAVVAAAVAALVAGLLALWVSRDQAVDPVSQERPGPVLLVPGYGGSEVALRQLAAALADRGREASVVHLAGNGTGDLRDQVPVLDRAVRQALGRSGASTVDIVGYSAGGVVARLWVADGGASLARRVLMLGSPNHGTNLAGFASSIAPDFCPAACRQLAPDSSLIRALNSDDETPSGPTWVSIWSDDDQVVFPPESASLDGAVDVAVQAVCRAAGAVSHGDLPTNPTVVNLVFGLLGAGEPSAPTAADC